MKSLRHINASTVDEAVNILKEYQGSARVTAGGTDILGVLKDKLLPDYPKALINIKTVSGLDQLRKDDDGLKIGPMVKLADLVNSPLVNEKYQMLAKAAQTVATPQIRNMGTVGGNLAQDTRCWYYRYPHSIGERIVCLRKGSGPCYAVKGDNRYHALFGGKRCFAVCPSDMATALTAFNAEIKTIGAEGKRTIPVQDFYTPLGNVLKSEELIYEINVPTPPEKAKQKFLKYTLRKPVDFAVVSAAVLVDEENEVCSEARIALGAVAPGPYRAEAAEQLLKGRSLDTETLEEAAEEAVKGAKPLSRNGYKIEIAKKLIKEGLLGYLD